MTRIKLERWAFLGIFFILAVLIVCCTGCGNELSVAPNVGALAPGFTLPTIDGQTVTLDELKGQPVLLSFGQTTCVACQYQLPYLQAAFEESGQEVKFIAIYIAESSDTVQQYTENEGVGFTVALDGDATAAIAYNIRRIPDNFFIDDQGVIKYIRVGAFSSTDELLAILDDL
jgi:peroxiredoxin